MSDGITEIREIHALPQDTVIAVKEAALEARDYFKILKTKLNEQDTEALRAQLTTLAEQMIAAKKIGQQAFLERLSFTWNVVLKEQTLHAMGFTKFVYNADIKTFLDKVEPARSVKIIELERFPRAIPLAPMAVIESVRAMNIFDDFCVVFTDFTDQDYQTPQEKAVVKRNRDPVVFGFFKERITGMLHERFYFITDWEDEHCDLTFNKMIERMAAAGIKNPAKTTSSIDHTDIQALADAALEEARDKGLRVLPAAKESFWDRMNYAVTGKKKRGRPRRD